MKDLLLIALNAEIEKYRNGTMNTNGYNQFNETVLESAIESVEAENAMFKKYIDEYDVKVAMYMSVMAIAFNLSTFEIPEISSAWTD